MKTQTENKYNPIYAKFAKERFDDFSEDKSQKVFSIVREAKLRGLLKKADRDKCLNHYLNAANYLLLVYSTKEFDRLITERLDYAYAYIALVATNSILTTA
ncbi:MULTISPECIES: hypothetical protein [unclassified Microcoleus]|uniref:hypothetical protein n=1 Tax=unclassified Microcoleus TaxID=2642155 RepID=UPI0025D37C7D|nr:MULTISPECIES: hypothetical protein [unclassified Microcoleus]